jgi:hypothetical protein
VWPQRQTRCGNTLRHARDIALEAFQINDERRSRNLETRTEKAEAGL